VLNLLRKGTTSPFTFYLFTATISDAPVLALLIGEIYEVGRLNILRDMIGHTHMELHED
jgi:hypothetical protein